MIGLKITIEPAFHRVQQAADKAAFRNFRHGAASISKDWKASIEVAPAGEPSEPGEPPHTHRGRYLSRAIRWEADKEGAVIGPVASIIGEELGPLHEFGGERGGVQFPARPSGFPALERAIPRFAPDWAGSIGE